MEDKKKILFEKRKIDLFKGRIENEIRCRICLEIFSFPVTIKCGHSFCEDCMERYKKSTRSNLKCPLCNCRFNSDQVIFLPGFRSIIDVIKTHLFDQEGDEKDDFEGARKTLKRVKSNGCDSMEGDTEQGGDEVVTRKRRFDFKEERRLERERKERKRQEEFKRRFELREKGSGYKILKTRIESGYNDVFRQARKRLNIASCGKIDDGVTHCVTQSVSNEEGERCAMRTFKVIQCTVLKIPIVELGWLRRCIDEEDILPFDQFELKRDIVSDRGISHTSSEAFENMLKNEKFCVIKPKGHRSKLTDVQIYWILEFLGADIIELEDITTASGDNKAKFRDTKILLLTESPESYKHSKLLDAPDTEITIRYQYILDCASYGQKLPIDSSYLVTYG